MKNGDTKLSNERRSLFLQTKDFERTTEHTCFEKSTGEVNKENIEPMALSTITKDWITKNGLERFIRVADVTVQMYVKLSEGEET